MAHEGVGLFLGRFLYLILYLYIELHKTLLIQNGERLKKFALYALSPNVFSK